MSRFGVGGPAAVEADHDDHRNLVARPRCRAPSRSAERAVAVQHQHLRVRACATLAPTPNGRPTPIVPNGARVQPVARHEGRDRLAAVVQDLLAVDHQDRVALQEVADLLAEPQRVDRRCCRCTSPSRRSARFCASTSRRAARASRAKRLGVDSPAAAARAAAAAPRARRRRCATSAGAVVADLARRRCRPGSPSRRR